MEKETLATVHCFLCAKNRMRFGLNQECEKCKMERLAKIAEANSAHVGDSVRYTMNKTSRVLKNDKKTSDK